MEGSCLCGQVQFQVQGTIEHAPEAFHCSQCRKVSGHFLAAVNVRRIDLNLVGGDETVSWYQSSPEVRRGFCGNCGSSLFWLPTQENYAYIAIAMGAFDKPTGLKLSKHTFVVDKGDYYDLADGVAQSDGY
ncbi:MAG: GFA family protein [Pseudomonadales bacterium]|nr:GFA family protein [Pseudomonadales bacterium]